MKKYVIVLVVIILLGGCVVSPGYHAPHGSGMQIGDPCNPPYTNAIQSGFVWAQSPNIPGEIGDNRDFRVWQNHNGVWYCEYQGHAYSRGRRW